MPDLVGEDWILYEPDYFGIVSKDPATALDFVDNEELRKHITKGMEREHEYID